MNLCPKSAASANRMRQYGGKMPEQDQTFYTRISERLRHKHRMLTMWDYEHMLLERFPQVYKVKCLPAEAPHLGQVEIIVIPDIRNKRPFDPFEPKAPSDLLADIAAYLAENSPAFAAVKVKNAHYVSVKVRFAVRFRPGYNEGYYKQRLNDELNRFLSPWAYEEGAEIVIGGRIYANVIINFIEEQAYVDYVAQVKLFTSEDGRTFKLALPSATEGYWVETDRPDGILVAAHQHEIDMIPDTGYEDESFVGINYMKIELDFVVG
ncbi:MAG: baseplate J/gp47 family protein [Anaerolineae bacterium]